MGKGYSNFMSKKAFHPASCSNQRRIHEAEEKAQAKRKHEEELAAQYQREQELYQQKLLISKESKDKLTLNFMYEAPHGAESSKDKQDGKIEWRSRDNPNKKVKCHKEEQPKVELDWKRENKQTLSASSKSDVKHETVKKETLSKRDIVRQLREAQMASQMKQ